VVVDSAGPVIVRPAGISKSGIEKDIISKSGNDRI
jgi:hypothetical protein